MGFGAEFENRLLRPTNSFQDLSFTGQNNDTVSNLYDFLFREYHPVQGRWISPDPAGLAAVDPMNPQTWNRYAYVGNSPLTSIDANGLVTLPGCEEGDLGCGLGGWGGCGALGGPEGDICTLLLPAIPIWGGGGEGSGSGGSGGGGTTNGGSTGSGGGTSGSVGSGGRLANFPNGENLGLPPGVSANWGGILGALLPIDPSCEFGTCLPGVEPFQGPEVFVPWLEQFGPEVWGALGAAGTWLIHELQQHPDRSKQVTKCTLNGFNWELGLCTYHCDDGQPWAQSPENGNPNKCEDPVYIPWRSYPFFIIADKDHELGPDELTTKTSE